MDKDKLFERYKELGWTILQAKCRYYMFPNSVTLSDFEYDQLEKEYDRLADELNQPKTASDMVGFDDKRHSCRLVLDKIRGFDRGVIKV